MVRSDKLAPMGRRGKFNRPRVHHETGRIEVSGGRS